MGCSGSLTEPRSCPLHEDPFHRALPGKVRIAAGRGVSFYYQDNLDILEQLGADIVPFSPLRDQRFQPALTASISGRVSRGIRSPSCGECRVDQGGSPECGGELVCLLAGAGGSCTRRTGFRTGTGRCIPWRSLPGHHKDGQRLQALGYTAAAGSPARRCPEERVLLGGIFFTGPSTTTRGQRRSLFPSPREKRKEIPRRSGKGNAFASYLPSTSGTNPAPAKRFIQLALRRKNRGIYKKRPGRRSRPRAFSSFISNPENP